MHHCSTAALHSVGTSANLFLLQHSLDCRYKTSLLNSFRELSTDKVNASDGTEVGDTLVDPLLSCCT